MRIGVGLNALGLLLFAGVPVLLGIMARARFPEIAGTPNLALPMVFMHGLPPLAGAIALAAVFSAEVSAADAVLFMLTTSFSQDLYKRFIEPGCATMPGAAGGAARDGRERRARRGARALLSADLVETLKIFYALLGVSLFVPIVAGLYVRRTTSDAARWRRSIGGVGGHAGRRRGRPAAPASACSARRRRASSWRSSDGPCSLLFDQVATRNR